MPTYQLSVWRKVQIFVEIEADTPEHARDKYESGNYDLIEEVVDSTDIEDPEIEEI